MSMLQNKKSLLLVAIALSTLCAVASSSYVYSSKNAEVVDCCGISKPKNGVYVFDSQSPFTTSEVTISSSTRNTIEYAIAIQRLGDLGGYSGIAIRDTSTSTLMYVSNDHHKGEEQEGCKISIIVTSSSSLIYIADNVPIKEGDSSTNCNAYHGMKAWPASDQEHVLNGKVTLSKIENIGFTEKDRYVYESLIPQGLATEVYIGYMLTRETQSLDGESIDASTTVAIQSNDIVNSYGFSIESPSQLNAQGACEPFATSYAMCTFLALLKDDNDGYWILTGESGEDIQSGEDKRKYFMYSTNKPEWKQKLPQAFIAELKRLGAKSDFVEFKQ